MAVGQAGQEDATQHPEMAPETRSGNDDAPASRSQQTERLAVNGAPDDHREGAFMFECNHAWFDRRDGAHARGGSRGLRAARGRLAGDLVPCNPFEEELVRQAVGHFWRLDRVESMECAILAERISTGRLMRSGGCGRKRPTWAAGSCQCGGRNPTGGPHPDRRGGADDPDDPARLVNRLEATADGCRWLLDRWAEKRRSPESGVAWSPAEMVEAIRLLGKRPLEDLDDWQVQSVILACFALDRQRPDPFAALGEGLAAAEVERFGDRLRDRRIGERMSCRPEQARAVLLEVVNESVAELQELERQHHEREEADAATAG